MTDQTKIDAATTAAPTIYLPLAALILSPINPRQEVAEADVAALADSIRTVGLLQNLLGFDRNGTVEIVAGGRRLRALQLLALSGEAPEFVPVQVTSDEAIALLWATTENAARQDLHAADEVRAYYKMMLDSGASVAQVALAFAVTEAHVRRRVVLGALPDEVLAALKADQITLDHAKAFTISSSRELSLEVLEQLINREISSVWQVRAAVQPKEIRGNDRRLKFVGIDAYTAAGGKSVTDLFEDKTVLHTPEALEKAFAEAMKAEAEKATQAGWKWAEPSTDEGPNWTAYEGYARIYPVEGELTEEQQERYDELAELWNGNAIDEVGEAELEALQIILDGCYTEEQRALSGLVLYVDWRGDLCSTAMVQPEDVAAAVEAGLIDAKHQNGAKAATGAASAEAAVKAKPPLSQALVDDLKAMRSAAIQGAILDKPELALDLIAFSLAVAFKGPLDIRAETSNITPTETEGFTPDERLADFDHGEDDPADPFEAFRAKGKKHRNAFLAYAAARTLKYGHQIWAKMERLPMFDNIEAEVKANIRQVWMPTAANFFSRVNADYLENLLVDLTRCDRGSNEFKGFSKAKKKEKAVILERLFADPETQALWKIDAEMKARIDAWFPEGF